jgi:cephalosporin hydroxylase
MEDISGWFIYNNILIQQHKNVKNVFTQLVNRIKPKRVLEIGTASGGLTLLIRDILDESSLHDTSLRSYDVIDKHYLHDQIKNGRNIEVIIKDVFNHQYNELKERDEIVNYIQDDGVTLVLCDGGSKKNEFKILSDYLKIGDVIMAHDYAPNEEYFQEHIHGKIWNWLEIQDSDINDACLKNNLVPYMDDDFKQVVWVCKIKE